MSMKIISSALDTNVRQPSLRGQLTPPEGSGQLPGSLLHTRASSPSTTATTGKKHRQKKEADETYV